MQVRKYDKKENLVFAHVLQTGVYGTAEYDAVYDETTKTLHVYDDLSHHDTSIINNIKVKDDVLELLGYSDGFVRSFINKVTGEPENSRVRMIVYITDMIWEITNENHPFKKVEDESLLYKPFYEKVQKYSRYQ